MVEETTPAKKEEKFKCPWGSFDLHMGFWNYNPLLSLSFEEQFRQNVENGFMCKHGWRKSRCTACKKEKKT
jgi:hypothetical protein